MKLYPSTWLGEPRPGEGPIRINGAVVTLAPMEGIEVGGGEAVSRAMASTGNRLSLSQVPQLHQSRLRVLFP